MSKNNDGHTQFNDEQEEVVNAATDDTDSTDEDAESKSEENADSDESAENKNDGENDSEDDAESEQDNGGDGTETKEEIADPRDEKITKLEEELLSIKETITKDKDAAQQQPPAKHVYSEEEKARISDMAKVPYETVEFFNGMLTHTVNQIRGFVEAQLGEINKSSAIEQFSKTKGFEDAVKYRGGMEEYLSKQPAHLRSKQETLEVAYHISRSKGMNSTMKKVMTSKDKNKRIVTQGRPKGGESTGKKSVSLTSDEVRAARSANMSLEDYAKYKQPLRMIK